MPMANELNAGECIKIHRNLELGWGRCHLNSKKNPHIYPFITSSSPEINSIRSASFDFHDSIRILSDALDFDECTNMWVVARCLTSINLVWIHCHGNECGHLPWTNCFDRINFLTSLSWYWYVYFDISNKKMIGKGNLACISYAGGYPVSRRPPRVYADTKIKSDVTFLSHYSRMPSHRRPLSDGPPG